MIRETQEPTGRFLILQAVLFLLAYSGFVAYRWHASEQVFTSVYKPVAISSRAAAAAEPLAKRAASLHREALGPRQEEPVQKNGDLSTAGNQESEVPALTGRIDEASLAQERVAQVSALASDSNANVRVMGILRLGTLPLATALPALQSALGDSDPRARVMAVSSLKRLAGMHGDESGRIREMLRQSASDGDTRVALAARNALNEIERRQRSSTGME